VTATPDLYHHFVAWSDGVTTPERRDTNVTGPASPSATFALDTYTMSYSANVHGSIDGSATQVIEHGSNATTVTAVPDVHHHFVRWSDGVGTAARRDLSVTSTASPEALFAIDTNTRSYTAIGGGSIDGSATQVIDYGSDATIVTAVPELYHHFVSWSDGVTTPTRRDADVTGHASVTAVFTVDTYTLAYGRSSVSPATPRRGKSVTLTAYLTPGSGATAGTSKLSLYHQERRTVWRKVSGGWKRVKVYRWRLETTRQLSASSDGRLTLRYKLPHSGNWKMVTTFSGPPGHESRISREQVFRAK
jgi:hypothetical protein